MKIYLVIISFIILLFSLQSTYEIKGGGGSVTVEDLARSKVAPGPGKYYVLVGNNGQNGNGHQLVSSDQTSS